MPLEPDAFRATLADYAFRTLWAAAVVLLVLVVARLGRAGALRVLAARRMHPNVVVLLANVLQLAVLLVGALAVLAIYTRGAFGVVLASFGVIGIVLGLSLQDLLKNFFAGIWVLLERPFRIGDSIEAFGWSGIVQEISFRTTSIRTFDGREVIIPNATFMIAPVVNDSRYRTRRVDLTLVLSTDDVPEDLASAVRDALSGLPELAADPPPSAVPRGSAGGLVRFRVRLWAADPEVGAAAAIGALRARFPQAEVAGA
ncbi:MAG: mechanosensitive ion channel family protein [Candidatus Limnocylindria bacterium]